MGVKEIVMEKQINIYPNPASDILTLSIDRKGNEEMRLNIYNVDGSFVRTVMMKQNQQRINISDLPAGVYVVNIVSEEWSVNKRLIVKE